MEETELARQRQKAERVDTQRLIAMAKVRDADELIKIIGANSSSVKSASTKLASTKSTESASTESASTPSLLTHPKFCFPRRFDKALVNHRSSNDSSALVSCWNGYLDTS